MSEFWFQIGCSRIFNFVEILIFTISQKMWDFLSIILLILLLINRIYEIWFHKYPCFKYLWVLQIWHLWRFWFFRFLFLFCPTFRVHLTFLTFPISSILWVSLMTFSRNFSLFRCLFWNLRFYAFALWLPWLSELVGFTRFWLARKFHRLLDHTFGLNFSTQNLILSWLVSHIHPYTRFEIRKWKIIKNWCAVIALEIILMRYL